jgi:hypothetical protein
MENEMKWLWLVCLLAACGGASSDDQVGDDDDGPVIDRRGTVAAVAGDFQSTGVISTVTSTPVASDNVIEGVVGSDPALRKIGDKLYIVNRFGAGGDNITILSATDLSLVDQIATGEGSNPQDVAVVGDTMYIPALGTAGVVVTNGTDKPHLIDLSALDDDGMPDCISAVAVGTKVFVACGLLNNFAADTNGKIAVIDTADDSVETTFDLPEKNPQGWLVQSGDDLLLGTVPDFQDYSVGCLVDITTGATPTATCKVTNADLGGFVSRVGVDDDYTWLVVNAYDENFFPSGWISRMRADAVPSAPLTPGTQIIVDLALCGGHVFASDGASAGMRVYHIASVAEETSEAVDLGLPPAYGNAIACIAP